MFIPATREEMAAQGWYKPDVILITGDSYIDSPHVGVSVIGHVLMHYGYRVAIIPQPRDPAAITRFGEPRLFWGVTSGCMDAMVSNYTSLRRFRRRDDLTAGGCNTKRPDRALIVYSNWIRTSYKHTAPIILGGIEASLRRLAHYDFWTNRVRRSVLHDAKADALLYGMAEDTVLQVAHALAADRPFRHLPGLCYLTGAGKQGYIVLPAYAEVAASPAAFARMFSRFWDNSRPGARGMTQDQGGRTVVHNPPPAPVTATRLDQISLLPFERAAHPCHKAQGPVRALETIRFSIATHRGCFGDCRFCAIAAHQGRRVISRSPGNILEEARRLSRHPQFAGTISDIGGPTANMYGMRCAMDKMATCTRLCLYPDICPNLVFAHDTQLVLLEKLRALGIRHLFVASGVRHDLVVADPLGKQYLEALMDRHTSGCMRVAPEHSHPQVLRLMRKPRADLLLGFLDLFHSIRHARALSVQLSYYYMVAHPGCGREEADHLQRFIARHLPGAPRSVQIFTPAPSTWSALMYHTARDPDSGNPLHVEHRIESKQRQKDLISS